MRETVADTFCEMESRWYDRRNQITEAQKMLEEYINGNSVLILPPCCAEVNIGQAQSM
ncbi:hypothetical protein UF75_2515 [Desulfosporosinus sp. I2]|uniref:hypothetical protein n=1 Tax=Desulfosporosinus sp. I2 TaxID=1617025 RepID=UPI00061E2E06|nr:hypothetical protein [Desulfosporosinus sp. I2]KJR47127.1 hypothetical protein UF75_2515 [Desulfosporosinus sp. I2]